METTLPNCVLEQFIICAFRYALDRKTGVLTEILQYIHNYWDSINKSFQEQIQRDLISKLASLDKDDLAAVYSILSLKTKENYF